jgi:hypothetical protein
MAETHYDPNNIITGSAMLYQGPIGTAAPAMPSAAGASIIVPNTWTPLGYTDAGIKIAYDPTYKDITVDEEMSPVDDLMTAEKLVISCALAEITLQNLGRVLSTAVAPVAVASGVGVPATLTFQQGGQQNTTKYAYLLIGNGPQGFPRMVNVYRAVATSKLDMTYKRGEKIMTPVEFTSLAYSANGIGNRLFQIIDKTANGQ